MAQSLHFTPEAIARSLALQPTSMQVLCVLCPVSYSGDSSASWQLLFKPSLSSPKHQAPACPRQAQAPKGFTPSRNQYFRLAQHPLYFNARCNLSAAFSNHALQQTI